MANITGRTVIFVDFQTNTDPTIIVATDSGFTQNVEHIMKANIRNFKVVLNQAPGSAYPYVNQTMAHVHLLDRGTWAFELQDVDDASHANWRTGDQAACTAFETELAASIPV